MKDIKIPGSAWVIALAIINTLPVALQDAFPGAMWVPLAVDLLLVAAKAIQVYMPKQEAVHPASTYGPEPLEGWGDEDTQRKPSKVRAFLMG